MSRQGLQRKRRRYCSLLGRNKSESRQFTSWKVSTACQKATVRFRVKFFRFEGSPRLSSVINVINDLWLKDQQHNAERESWLGERGEMVKELERYRRWARNEPKLPKASCTYPIAYVVSATP